MRRSSLATSFTITVSLLILVAGAAMIFISETAGRQVADALIRKLQQEQLAHTLDDLEHRLNAAQRDLIKADRMIKRLGIERLAAGDLEKVFLEIALNSEAVSSMYLGGINGGLVGGGHDGLLENPYIMATDDSAAGTLRKFTTTDTGDRGKQQLAVPDFDSRERPWFVAARQADRLVWGAPYLLSTGQDLALSLSMPVSLQDGTPLGVLGADVFLGGLTRFLRSIGPDDEGARFIMDNEGYLIASSLDEQPFLVDDRGRPTGERRLARDSKAPAVAAGARAFGELYPVPEAFTGTRSFSVGDPEQTISFAAGRSDIGNLDWIVVTTVSKNHYLPPIIKARQNSLVVIFVSLFLLGLISVVYGRSVIVALEQLRMGVGAVAAGDLATQIDIDLGRRDEIGDLADSFNLMLSNLRDETRCREEALQVAEAARQRAELLLNISQTIVHELSADGTFVAVNDVALGLWGYEASEIIGRNCYDILTPEGMREERKNRFAQWMSGAVELEATTENEVTTKDGRILSIKWRNALIRNENGEVIGIMSTGLDVTDVKHNEEQLQRALREARLAEQRVRDFATASSDWFWETDEASRFTAIYTAISKRVDLDSSEVIGKTRWEVAKSTGQNADWEAHRRTLEARLPFRNFEYRVSGASGERWYSVSGIPVYSSNGDFFGYRGTGSDVTARKEIENRLLFDVQIIEMLSEGVCAVRLKDGAIIYSNPAFDALFGYEPGEVIGKHVSILNPPADETALEQSYRFKEYLSVNERWQTETTNVRKDGTTFLSDVSFSIWQHPEQGRIAISVRTDITERRASEQRLSQTHRIEALGQLTGGVAHDFNNLLAITLGTTELLEDELADNEAARPLIATIKRTVERGASLTSRLLAFSRRQPLSAEDVDVLAMLRTMEGVLNRTLGADIALNIQGEDALWRARVDPGQLESAVINLAINARHAMPGSGSLTIDVKNVSIGRGVADPKPGDYVRIRMTDTGTGMTPEVQAKAFEPFFTTKPVGEGSGLGLSMVYGFAKQSRGGVTLDSKPGVGTSVTILLPRAPGLGGVEPVADEEFSEGGSERILVVEDQPDLRRNIVAMLTHAGYSVAETENADEALEVSSRHGPFDLLLTDVVLPGSSDGPGLAKALGGTCPGLRVIFMSGYLPGRPGLFEADADDRRLLMKPIRRSDLLKATRSLLDAHRSGA